MLWSACWQQFPVTPLFKHYFLVEVINLKFSRKTACLGFIVSQLLLLVCCVPKTRWLFSLPLPYPAERPSPMCLGSVPPDLFLTEMIHNYQNLCSISCNVHWIPPWKISVIPEDHDRFAREEFIASLRLTWSQFWIQWMLNGAVLFFYLWLLQHFFLLLYSKSKNKCLMTFHQEVFNV